ncbi:hypothetical protein GCM10023189_07090 [Nibrella saemangeumensis]|uniref:Uncharacterized protein n=2 Tax=Nibrella saemangeumensis TaxID=1084526 RepID=A0ABP8MGC7_9BACT
MQKAYKAGWIDIWKRDNKEEVWSFRQGKGRSRPDHIYTTQPLASCVKNVWYSFEELDRNFSDHAPMLAEIDIYL